MTAANSVRRLEMQNFVFSCGGVLPESGRVGTPAETLFTMGKGLKMGLPGGPIFGSVFRFIV